MRRETVGWIGLVLTYIGVGIQAVFPSVLRYSFPAFLVAAITWALYAFINSDRPLFVKQLGLIVLDTIAVIRWFH